MGMRTTLSIRVDNEDYEFLKKMAKENKEEISKAVRGLVGRGRLMYAIDLYKSGKASIGRSSEIAGVSVSEMMDILSEFGITNRIEVEDYARGLENLRAFW